MATQKEKIDALTAELAEEKKATKRARTERDKYKAQLAERGEKCGSFTGHVVLGTAAKIEKEWRHVHLTNKGKHALHYENGSVEFYSDRSSAVAVQKHNAYSKQKGISSLHAVSSSHYICTFAEGCTEQSFGTVIAGDFTAYVSKDDDGKVKSVTLIAD